MANSELRKLELRYELDDMHWIKEVLHFLPGMSISALVSKIKENDNVSKVVDDVVDIAVFYDEVQMDVVKTFAECNIPAGAILTVKKVFTLPPSSPSPESESEAEAEAEVSQKAPAPT